MVEPPYGPERRDRDDEPRPGSPSRAGFAGEAPDERAPGALHDLEGDEWELPDWVDGLDAEALEEESGQRVATSPGALLGLGDESGSGASDFLGLDEELLGREELDRADFDPKGAPAVLPEDFEVLQELPAHPQAARRAPLPERPAAPQDEDWGIDGEMSSGASWLMDLDEESGFETGAEDEQQYMPELVALPRGGLWRSGGGRLALAAVLVALAAGAIQMYGPFGTDPGEAPTRPPLARPERIPAVVPETFLPPPNEGETELAEAAGTTAPAGAEAVGAHSARPLAGRDPLLAFTDIWNSVRARGELPFFLTHFSAGAGDSALVARPGELGARGEFGGERESRETIVSAADLVVLPEYNSPFRTATSADLAMMWLGSTIPMEAIDRPDRLLTPNVGPVRVILHGGELFDGRLYAVGGKKVWLETRIVRMALLSHQIDRIEHIESGRNTPSLGEKGSQRFAGLDRVRVRTPGGVFYGKLLNRDGDVVTLLTSEGVRITLHDARVEPAGLSHTRIVDASAPALEEVPRPVVAPTGARRPR